MKYISSLFLLVLALLFQQCGEDDPDSFTLDQEIKIKQEEIIRLDLEDDNGYIEVQVINITDSRCPSDVTCVRYGEADVKVAVTGLQEIATVVDLCIGDCPQRSSGFMDTDTVEVAIDNQDYAVILLDVVPYPTTFNQSQTKEAWLKIISQ